MGTGVEAVIISGERKGAVVKLPEEEVDMAELRSLLRAAVDAANEMAVEAQGLRRRAEAFVNKAGRRRGRR